jgi:hypothetical protein
MIGRPMSKNGRLARMLAIDRKRVYAAGGAEKLQNLDESAQRLLLGTSRRCDEADRELDPIPKVKELGEAMNAYINVHNKRRTA